MSVCVCKYMCAFKHACSHECTYVRMFAWGKVTQIRQVTPEKERESENEDGHQDKDLFCHASVHVCVCVHTHVRTYAPQIVNTTFANSVCIRA